MYYQSDMYVLTQTWIFKEDKMTADEQWGFEKWQTSDYHTICVLVVP